MPKLSLCMIVERHTSELEQTLMTLVPFVDEIVIATQDTNWASKTNQEDRAPFFNIYYYEWQDDFAAARNDTFAKATGEVVFWIDADDKVIHPAKLPELAKLITDGQCDWVSLKYIYEKDDFGRIRAEQWKPRLMRTSTGVWEKSVHEVFKATQPVTVIKDTEVIIDHQAKESATRSAERNLRLLLQEYEQDKDKTDPRTIYNLAMTLLTLGRIQEALPFYAQHIKVCGWPEEKYFSVHYMVECLFALGLYDQAINASLESTKIKPEWALAYFDLARAYSFKRDWAKVTEWSLVGARKQKPSAEDYFTNDTDYTVFPLLRVGEAYLQLGDYSKAQLIATELQPYKADPLVADFLQAVTKVLKLEDFVESFTTVAGMIADTDRVKAAKLFDCLPHTLDEDARIQAARFAIVPPKSWSEKSIVIFCPKNQGGEWAKPSIYTGIGGSEEAVIHMSEELTKLGYEVTVYNECGDFRGTYNKVQYLPYYQLNVLDRFHIFISWRAPGVFTYDIQAQQKLLWLHDIAFPELFPQEVITKADKIIFLSQWHRRNLPAVPDEKVFISNNGIDPDDFKRLPAKEANTLFWGSSYDRGLLPFLQHIFPLIIKAIPDVKLHVAYGWNNIKRLIDEQPGIYIDLENLYKDLAPILETHPNIVHHGRLSHKKVAELMGQCLVYPYATEFGETNNITSQKCQAAGCYVITTRSSGGTPEYLQFGRVVEGTDIYTNKQLQQKFADTVVLYSKNQWAEANKTTREKLLHDFAWSTTAKHWHETLLNPTKTTETPKKRPSGRPRATKPVRREVV